MTFETNDIFGKVVFFKDVFVKDKQQAEKFHKVFLFLREHPIQLNYLTEHFKEIKSNLTAVKRKKI